MALDVDKLVQLMTATGKGLAGTIWSDMQTYALPELRKIGTQVVAIETEMSMNPPAYTQDGARALMGMQINATIGVIVSMTTLTLLAVQSAVNAIIQGIRDVANKAIGFALI
jgi:hypothetical protein